MSTQPAKLCGVPQEIERSVSRAHLAHSMGYKANFNRAELFADREPFFLSSGRGDLLRKVLLGSLKTSRIQRFISLCSVRIQASPFRISLSSFSRFPLYIRRGDARRLSSSVSLPLRIKIVRERILESQSDE